MFVVFFSSDIVYYLLTRDDLVINSRNFWDETALLLATRRGNYDICRALLEKGADVNKGPNYPIQAAVQFPNILRLLIDNGADLNTQDIHDETALHEAIAIECVESVGMLLYYNADANIPGDYDITPFAKSLIMENREIQSMLIDYVTDFNALKSDGSSVLLTAVRSQSYLLADIVARGAKFHYYEYLDCYTINNIATFRLLWNTIDSVPPELLENVFPFLNGLMRRSLELYATAIMENEYMMEKFSTHLKLHRFIKILGKYELLDLATKYTYIFLMYGYQLCFQDVREIFKSFGMCKLFLEMRYFDLVDRPLYIDCSEGWLPWVLFSLEGDLNAVKIYLGAELDCEQFNKDLRFLFKYIACERVRSLAESCFKIDIKSTVPSLLELARNKSKEALIQKYKLRKTTQYYNLIDSLVIPDDYKSILKYERKLYSVLE